jgi:hypothetical protein
MDFLGCVKTVNSLLASSKRLQPFAKQLHLKVSSTDTSSSVSTSSPSSSSSSSSSSSLIDSNFTSSKPSSYTQLNNNNSLHSDQQAITFPDSKQLPTVYVTCRHSTNAGIPVDNLGGGGSEEHFDDTNNKSVILPPVSGIGFFNLDGITILHDRVSTRDDIEQLLTHELVHAVDHHVTKLDLTTCGGLACSEVRAAKFAECNASWELGGVKKRCARNFAKMSTRMVFGPVDGSLCVDHVLNECFEKV